MIDYEKISTSLKERNIGSVLFDMDNTLVQTHRYYKEEHEIVLRDILKDIYYEMTDEDIDRAMEDIYMIVLEIYSKNPRPVLIDEQIRKGFVKYFEERNQENLIPENIGKILKEAFSFFYKKSPILFPSSIEILNLLKKFNISKGVYSHAQYDWTKIKIELLKQLYQKKYNRELELPFFTTDISDEKDLKGWSKAIEHLDFKKETTLVIGDSLTSDILPAINAEIKNLVYISKKDDIPWEELPNDVSIKIVENIGELLNDF